MCKYINRRVCIVPFHRRLPTNTLSTSACRLCGFCSSPRFFSTHMVHVVVSDRHVLPWKLSKISRPSRQAFHSHCGRAKGASASAREYRPVLRLLGCANSCWGNDPGSVGAPALLGSAVEPETSLQISVQQQFEEVKRSCPRNPSGGRALHRRRGTCFSCSGSYCIQQRWPILLSCCQGRIGRARYCPLFHQSENPPLANATKPLWVQTPDIHSTKFFRPRQWSLKFTSVVLSMDTSRPPMKREIL